MVRNPLIFVLGLLVTTAGCRMGLQEIARPGEIGKSELVGVKTGDKEFWAAARVVKLPSSGVMLVKAEPQLPNQNLEIVLMPPSGGGLPLAKGVSPLESPKLPAGEYFVVVTSAPGARVHTRATMEVLFKPEQPDENSGDDRVRERARALTPGKAVHDTVDYAAADATDWYKITMPTVGDLEVKFTPEATRGVLSAEVFDTEGNAKPVTGQNRSLKLAGSPAGEYFIKVTANDVGAGAYALSAAYTEGDPDALSGEDATPEGATIINLSEKNGRLLGIAKDDVSYDKQDATDWFKFDVPADGKLSIRLKPKDRSSRIQARFVTDEEDEEGERVRSGFSVDVVKQSYWVKVQAPDKGDASAYTLEVEVTANKFIDSVVVEIDRQRGCFLMVNKGSNHGVRTGVLANVMQGTDVLGTGKVDSAFPSISKIKMFDDCRYSAGTTVKIQDTSY